MPTGARSELWTESELLFSFASIRPLQFRYVNIHPGLDTFRCDTRARTAREIFNLVPLAEASLTQLSHNRECEIIPITALVVGLISVIADGEDRVIRQICERTGDWIGRGIVDRGQHGARGELLIAKLFETKLSAALNCHSIGNHLICFGPFRFDSVAIGPIGFDCKGALDREGIRLLCARSWGQERSRPGTRPDSYRTCDNSLASEHTSVYP